MATNITNVQPLPQIIPDALRDPLARLRDGLAVLPGSNFKSLVLYGGVARGEFKPGSSDVNLLLVLESASLEALSSVRTLLVQARNDFEPALMILTPSDLGRAADCFPTKFLDIQRNHVLVAGLDLISKLSVPRDRLLRQSLRELQNLLMRLRHFYLERAAFPERLERTVQDALPGCFANLATLLEVQLGRSFKTRQEMIPELAGYLGLPEQGFKDLLALKRGELKPDPASIAGIYQLLMTTVGTAVERAGQPG